MTLQHKTKKHLHRIGFFLSHPNLQEDNAQKVEHNFRFSLKPLTDQTEARQSQLASANIQSLFVNDFIRSDKI